MSRSLSFVRLLPLRPPAGIRLPHRTAGATALVVSLALAACSTPAPPPRPPASPKTASRSAPPPARPAPPSKSAKAGKSKKAPADAAASGKRSPETVARADRTFLKPARGAIIQGFDGRNNKGVDFAGSLGDPVRAAREGQVVFAGSALRGYGRLIMIKHDGDYLTAYAHNSELLVKTGDRVKRGQVIARMGNSESDRVKLHFELRRKGNAVDPLPYFLPDGAGGTDAGSGADPG